MKFREDAEEVLARQRNIFSSALQKAYGLISVREAIPLLGSHDPSKVVPKSHYLPYQVDDDDPRLSQRLGDLFLSDLFRHTAYETDSLTLQCGCGKSHKISRTTLRKHQEPTKNIYYPPIEYLPINKETALYAPEEMDAPDMAAQFGSGPAPARAYTCRHIHLTLKEAFPQPAELLRKLIGHVSTLSSRGEGDSISAPLGWFRKDLGLLMFLQDVGLPTGPNMTLRRQVVHGSYAADQFYWHQWGKRGGSAEGDTRSLPAKPGLTRVEQVLRQRMLTAKSRAKRLHVPFLFDGLEHFLTTISPLPKGFEENPEGFRLYYDNQGKFGIGPGNFRWKVVNKESPKDGLKEAPARAWADLYKIPEALQAESHEDLLRRIQFLMNEVDKLDSQETYCVDPDFVEAPDGKPVRDVYATLLRKVIEAKL